MTRKPKTAARDDWEYEMEIAEAALTVMARLCPGNPHTVRLGLFAAMVDLFGPNPPPWIDVLRPRIEGPLPPLDE